MGWLTWKQQKQRAWYNGAREILFSRFLVLPATFEFWRIWKIEWNLKKRFLPEVGVEPWSSAWESGTLSTELLLHLNIKVWKVGYESSSWHKPWLKKIFKVFPATFEFFQSLTAWKVPYIKKSFVLPWVGFEHGSPGWESHALSTELTGHLKTWNKIALFELYSSSCYILCN